MGIASNVPAWFFMVMVMPVNEWALLTAMFTRMSMSPRAIAAVHLNIPGCGAGTGARTVPPSRPFPSLARPPATIPLPTKAPYMLYALWQPSYRMMPDGGTPSDTSARHTALTTATLGWLSPRQLTLTAALTSDHSLAAGLRKMVPHASCAEFFCARLHAKAFMLASTCFAATGVFWDAMSHLRGSETIIFGSRQLTTRRLSMCGLICFPASQPLFCSKALAGNT